MAKENFFEIAYTLENTEDTRKMYDRWAKVYDQDLTEGEYQQPARCASALKAVSPEESIAILDVGCGTGLSGMALKQAGYKKIDGCDLSQGMLDKAANLDVYGRLFTCDLNKPPLDAKDEFYDAVTAVGVFSFGHVLPDAVDELRRITKLGGYIVIGLNDHFYEEGSLTDKLEDLKTKLEIDVVSEEHGAHIPGNDLQGWVITIRKIH